MKYIYLSVLAAIIFLACQKELKEEPNILPPTPVFIETSIQGKVLDENQEPVAGSTVTVGTVTTTTNADGIFRLDSVDVNIYASVVKVSKTGYFKAIRTFNAAKGILNYVQLQLIPSNAAGKFAAASGGTVQIPNGGTIVFKAGGIVTAAGNVPYTGNVNVSAHFIDPTLPELPYVMPGDMRGVTLTGEEKGLQSFGMVAVELTDEAGSKLQLAPNTTATVTLPVPASLTAAAPATIPIWYFDEDRGLWKETGSGTKTGSNYSFTVSHFSYWNCDVPYPKVSFQAIIQGVKGTPMFDQRVEIGVTGTGYRAYGVTDSTGKISGSLAAGVPLELKVFDKCGNVIYTKPVGPFTQTVDLGTITVDAPVSGNVVITGTVLNCSGTNVTKGTALIFLDNYYYKAKITNGSFSISVDRCNTASFQASVSAVDSLELKESATISMNITAGTFNAGTLTACDVSAVQFFNIDISGDKYNISQSDSVLNFNNLGTTSRLAVNYYEGNRFLSLSGEIGGAAKGTFPFNISYLNAVALYSYRSKNTNDVSVTVTEYGGAGKYAAGTFSGILTSDSTAATVNVSGDFRIKIK